MLEARTTSPACRISCAPPRARAAAERGIDGQARHHAVAVERRAVPAVLRAARPAREGVPRLDRARRQRRQDRQQGDHRRDGGAARRAREAARLRELRPLPPRRRDGEDAGRPCATCSTRSGRRRARARSPTATPCRGWCAQEGGNFELAPWDWRYYAEKLRKVRCDIDEATIKPYLQLDNIIEAAFYTAYRLFGLSFERAQGRAGLASGRAVWEVRGADGRHLGLFFGDYFARASKRSGAWMTTLRDQERLTGDVRPLVINVMNFTKGGDGEPTLLSFDDARTLFHEFGHALHGLLSDVTYPMVAGTSVLTDWVELPSQLYEHWLERPEMLRRFAVHCPHRRADAGRSAQAAAGCAQLQPGLRDGRICRLARWSISTSICCRTPKDLDVGGVRGGSARRASACRPRS